MSQWGHVFAEPRQTMNADLKMKMKHINNVLLILSLNTSSLNLDSLDLFKEIPQNET